MRRNRKSRNDSLIKLGRGRLRIAAEFQREWSRGQRDNISFDVGQFKYERVGRAAIGQLLRLRRKRLNNEEANPHERENPTFHYDLLFLITAAFFCLTSHFSRGASVP